MARTVRVGEFQRLQRQSLSGPSGTSTGEVEAAPDAAVSNGHDAAPTLTVPEQLAALDLHVSAHPPYDEVVKRLRVRASLLDIPALDEEIAAEAGRRCGMLPEASASATTDEAENAEVSDEQVAQILADNHARGRHTGLTIDGCPACSGAESGPGSALFAEQTADEESGYDGPPFDPKAEDQAEPDPDDEDGPSADEVASFERIATLISLNIESICTAEMSLHMITERVRDAVQAAGELLPSDPSDAEIVAEAERIWVSLDRKRSHTYSVDADGTVRDWRRPDTTPDRGDVTKEHTITDDEPRFSGAGASDDVPFKEPSKLVPTDQQFGGKLYRDAPELANIAEKLIGEHGFLEGLINCEIRYYWRRKTGVSKGRVKIGYCKRASDLLGHFSNADFIIWLSATTARDGKFTDRQLEAAVFHQLLHIETDDEGNFISARHDFEGFAQEIRHYGTWTEDLKLVVPAFTAAQQMGLFDVDDEGIEDDEDDDGEGESAEQAYFDAAGEAMERDRASDGAGVLIHPDGTALTDDEIEAMERHELADDDDDPDEEDDDVDAYDPLEDGPADPDGPAPDDDDPLADHDV